MDFLLGLRLLRRGLIDDPLGELGLSLGEMFCFWTARMASFSMETESWPLRLRVKEDRIKRGKDQWGSGKGKK